jgi:hypothetical protein
MREGLRVYVGFRVFESPKNPLHSNSKEMIGFQPELQGDQPQPDEGLDTKNLEKRELFDMVTSVWCLPPYASKGVTRDYLLKVHRGSVFRVNTNELKRFEADLSKEAQKKIGTINNALLVRKLNILLNEQRKPVLGFTEYEIPESAWLHRVARFIDQTSLLEVFERPVRPEPQLNGQSNACSKIYFGRVHASSYLFRTPQVRQNKKLWESFKMISDTYRSVLSYRINLDILQRELDDTMNKIAQYENHLSDQITKSAFTYTALENPNIRQEVILGGPENFTGEMRELLNGNIKL